MPRVPFEDAHVTGRDYVSGYVDDLASVIDLDAIRDAGIRIGADPLGGASVAYWQAIRDRHGLDIEIVNDAVDPTFRFVPLDHDGKIRMDCSSPYAMGRLRELADRFDVAFANDPDADRHGIVTPSAGLLEPEPPPRGVHRVPVRRPPRLGRGRRHRQDARELVDHRPRRRPTSGGGWSRSRSASSGSSPACSTARSGSAARRAPAPRSCAATAPRGAPTRTG